MALIEGRDYYVERGRYVFTARYLLNRGHCCGAGCRHCPYRLAASLAVGDAPSAGQSPSSYLRLGPTGKSAAAKPRTPLPRASDENSPPNAGHPADA
ncbi:MAG: hypothetical protein CFK52_07905 [Chloracidobacterium sp. CP2_5A]|nr:MAG: hypothetical protein CFK52_07905 [Chloracidobacterium sp. CP2_5A]